MNDVNYVQLSIEEYQRLLQKEKDFKKLSSLTSEEIDNLENLKKERDEAYKISVEYTNKYITMESHHQYFNAIRDSDMKNCIEEYNALQETNKVLENHIIFYKNVLDKLNKLSFIQITELITKQRYCKLDLAMCINNYEEK